MNRRAVEDEMNEVTDDQGEVEGSEAPANRKAAARRATSGEVPNTPEQINPKRKEEPDSLIYRSANPSAKTKRNAKSNNYIQSGTRSHSNCH